MKTYMLWFGGSSYAAPNHFCREHIDECDSIAAAKDLFYARYKNQAYPYTPCVDESAEAWLFFEDPFEIPDAYPDRIIRFGPRGGIILEHT